MIMRTLLALSLLFVATNAQCSWNSPNGRFDFSKHTGDGTLGPVMDQFGSYNIYLTVCDDGNHVCNLAPVMASRTFAFGTPTCQILGQWQGTTPVWSMVPPDLLHAPNGGVQMSFSNGDPCPSTGLQMSTNVVFACDGPQPVPPTVPPNTFSVETTDTFSCEYKFTVPSDACIGDAQGNVRPSGAAGDGAGGLSGGWIFVIIVLVCAFVYFVGGFIYKTRQKGTSGMESIPNIDFWRQVPGLVKDGAIFTWSKIRGNKYEKMDDSSGGGGDYNQQQDTF